MKRKFITSLSTTLLLLPTMLLANSSDDKIVTSSFKKKADKLLIFAKNQPLVFDRQKYSESSTGEIVLVNKFNLTTTDYNFDIKKTNSIIFPYRGYMEFGLALKESRKCGNTRVFKKTPMAQWAFDSEESALAESKDSSCFIEDYTCLVTLNFSYSDKKWIFIDATSKPYSGCALLINYAAGKEIPFSRIPTKLNEHWKVILNK